MEPVIVNIMADGTCIGDLGSYEIPPQKFPDAAARILRSLLTGEFGVHSQTGEKAD